MESDLEMMLYETVLILEGCNLMELLPVNVEAWFQNKKLESQDGASPAIEFIAKRLEEMK